ncbi:SurA N-terminal domain-containing protein [Phosphitispora sp. TUW77]|uniref:SurA N-terminal domain-containing protein n=1 Tax=Phosphitispora sp. TUW77 TaxID=3152361 RepID=UPI003AB2BB63
MGKNLRMFTALMIILVFSFTVTGCGSKTIASVNGEKITREDLDKRMDKEKLYLEQQGASFSGQEGQMMLKALEKQTLEKMIEQTLIAQIAKEEGVYPSKSEIDKQVQQIIGNFGSEAQFEAAMKQYNYTLEDIKQKVSFETAYTKLHEKVTADVKVSDAEIKKYYDDNKEQFIDPVKIGARAILIKYDNPNQVSMMGQKAPTVGRDEEEAKEIAAGIIKELNSGADFEKLAKEKSEDAGSKEDGGLIKDIQGNSPYAKDIVMPAEFDAAAIGLKVGQYTKEPVKTNSGYYIIKLESLTEEKQLSFEEARAQIEQTLPIVKKQQKFAEYITEIKQKAQIENKLAEETM